MSLAHSLEIAAGVEGEKELLHCGIALEVPRFGEKVLNGFRRAGPEARVHRMTVDVGVLDDDVTPRGYQRAEGAQLLENVGSTVVRVEDDEDRLGVLRHLPDLCQHLLGGRRPL